MSSGFLYIQKVGEVKDNCWNLEKTFLKEFFFLEKPYWQKIKNDVFKKAGEVVHCIFAHKELKNLMFLEESIN